MRTRTLTGGHPDEVLRLQRRGTLRCDACGFITRADCPKCLAHPAAALIGWDREHGYAENYIQRMARAGEDVDAFVADFNPTYFPGVGKDAMAHTLELLRRWGTLASADTRAATPAGLFG